MRSKYVMPSANKTPRPSNPIYDFACIVSLLSFSGTSLTALRNSILLKRLPLFHAVTKPGDSLTGP